MGGDIWQAGVNSLTRSLSCGNSPQSVSAYWTSGTSAHTSIRNRDGYPQVNTKVSRASETEAGTQRWSYNGELKRPVLGRMKKTVTEKTCVSPLLALPHNLKTRLITEIFSMRGSSSLPSPKSKLSSDTFKKEYKTRGNEACSGWVWGHHSWVLMFQRETTGRQRDQLSQAEAFLTMPSQPLPLLRRIEWIWFYFIFPLQASA